MPVFNEEQNLPYSLGSLNRQTVKPSKIIVVNDGSTDGSVEVVKDFMDETYCLVRLPRKNRQPANWSLHYSWVLSEGSKELDVDFDYVGILDADTLLEARYYEKLIREFRVNPNMGITSGSLVNMPRAGLVLRVRSYVLGCNRLYSRSCWLNLNEGLVLKVLSPLDTYHNLYARHALGYTPRRFNDVKSYALRRPKGNQFLDGYRAWQYGYYPWFLLGRAISSHSPAFLAGFLKAWLVGKKQGPIKPYVRQVQLGRIKRLLKVGEDTKEYDLKVAEELYKTWLKCG